MKNQLFAKGATVLALSLLLGACSKPAPTEEPVRAVKLMTVSVQAMSAGAEFAGEVRARVRQAKHTQVSRLQEITDARDQVVSDVTAAWSRMIGSRAQIKSDQIQIDANKIALEGVREEERVGQRTLLEVLNAEQEYLNAQEQLARTRRDLVVANYSLLSSIGHLTGESIAANETLYDAEAHYNEVRREWFDISITHEDGRTEVVDVGDGGEDQGPMK